MKEERMTDIMVSTREVPWMKMGKIVEGAQIMHAKDAAVLGGLNFDVEKQSIMRVKTLPNGDTDAFIPIKERVAIVRTDTDEWLGIMGADYPILQFAEAFDFMDGVGNGYVAAGALKGGKQGFMVVELPQYRSALGINDWHSTYAILRTSHDGTRAIEVSVQQLREKCMNQLTLNTFTKGAEHKWSVTHTTNMHKKLVDAAEAMKNVGVYVSAFEDLAQRLVERKISDDQARKILKIVIPENKNAKTPKQAGTIERILSMWKTDPTVDYAGTGWGLTQAVSGYMEWDRYTGKEGTGNSESKFTNALVGSTFKATNKTAQLVLQTA
jgi:phage/plasmid-like protein (TIGR03299 family)